MLTTAEIIAEADRCVACGLCLPHCPTYHKTGSEADSPRGRIQLMSADAREILPANARFKQHIDLCLSCRNCETACPNGVRYGALIDTARAIVAKTPDVTDNTIRYFIAKPNYARLASNVLRYAQTLGLTALASKIPTLKSSIALLPPMPVSQTWCALYTTNAPKKGAVNLFLGCASNAFDTDTLRASVYVLNRLGYDVNIPPVQTCCGGLARQNGDMRQAELLVNQNKIAFQKDLTTLTVASGCGAGLQDYTDLTIKDISAFLATADWENIEISPLKQTITVHDPCTLRNVQKSHASVYDLLKKIPQANIKPLSGNAQCCGGAGFYMLNQPQMAAQLLNDKTIAIQQSQPQILATSNIGCALHIAAGLRKKNIHVAVLHPVSIMAKQMGFTGKLD